MDEYRIFEPPPDPEHTHRCPSCGEWFEPGANKVVAGIVAVCFACMTVGIGFVCAVDERLAPNWQCPSIEMALDPSPNPRPIDHMRLNWQPRHEMEISATASAFAFATRLTTDVRS